MPTLPTPKITPSSSAERAKERERQAAAKKTSTDTSTQDAINRARKALGLPPIGTPTADPVRAAGEAAARAVIKTPATPGLTAYNPYTAPGAAIIYKANERAAGEAALRAQRKTPATTVVPPNPYNGLSSSTTTTYPTAPYIGYDPNNPSGYLPRTSKDDPAYDQRESPYVPAVPSLLPPGGGGGGGGGGYGGGGGGGWGPGNDMSWSYGAVNWRY